MAKPPNTKRHGTQDWAEGRLDGPAIVYAPSTDGTDDDRLRTQTCDWSRGTPHTSICQTVYMTDRGPLIWRGDATTT